MNTHGDCIKWLRSSRFLPLSAWKGIEEERTGRKAKAREGQKGKKANRRKLSRLARPSASAYAYRSQRVRAYSILRYTKCGYFQH